ncbi:MAG: hypothetical protein V9E89_19350 [Ilumatobacteraceae bacterium]
MTPSHTLAEEAAAAWRKSIAGPVAVLRGYDGKDPVTWKADVPGSPIWFRLAIAVGASSVGKSVCLQFASSGPATHSRLAA